MFALTVFESMIFYITIYWIFSINISIIVKSKLPQKIKNVLFFVCIGGVSLVFSTRYFVGTDYSTYYSLYLRYSQMSLTSMLQSSGAVQEIAMLILYRVTGIFGPNFLFFLFVSNVLILTPFVFGVSKFKGNFNFFFAIFWFMIVDFSPSLNVIRQYISVSIIFYAVIELMDDRDRKFWFLSVLAFLFHYSAIVVIIAYLVKQQCDKMKGFNIVLMLKLATVITISLLFLNVFKHSLIIQRYLGYLVEDIHNSNNLSFYLNALLLIVFFILRKKLFRSEENLSFLYWLTLLGLLFSAFGFITPFAKRIAVFFTIFNSILIGYIANINIIKLNRVTTKFLILIYLIMYFVIIYVVLKHSGIVPFTFKL